MLVHVEHDVGETSRLGRSQSVFKAFFLLKSRVGKIRLQVHPSNGKVSTGLVPFGGRWSG